jgi:hypothetical protein
MTPSTRKSLRSSLIAALLLGVVLLCRARSPWADWYALHIYPVWSGAMSWLSARLPVSLDEWVVVAAAVLAFVYLIFLRKRWAALVSLLLWITVWFYAGWGLNYFRSSIYDRAGKQLEAFEAQRFRQFLDGFARELNDSYQPFGELDKAPFEQEIKQYYTSLPPQWGLAKPEKWQKPKRLLFNRLYSAVGVSGFVGPFFSEIQINEEIPPRQYPVVYAHELSHLMGVSNEAEANYWAYRACSASADPQIRYAALQSMLPYVLNNARTALSDEDYKDWQKTLRPEVLAVLRQEQEYWKERYSPLPGRIQSWFYNLFLKSNRIRSGTANYNEVVQMILTLSD